MTLQRLVLICASLSTIGCGGMIPNDKPAATPAAQAKAEPVKPEAPKPEAPKAEPKAEPKIEPKPAAARDAEQAKIKAIINRIIANDKAAQRRALDELEHAAPKLHGPVLTLLVDTVHVSHVEACKQLANMGADAEPAAPFLAETLRCHLKMVRQRRNDYDGLPLPPEPKLTDPPACVPASTECIKTLAVIAPTEETVKLLSTVVACTNNDDGLYHYDGLVAMAKISRKNPDTRPAIIEALTAFLARPKTDFQNKLQAITTLASYGPDAKKALPALANLKTDPVAQVREAAKDAIAKIGGK
jgi:hypothetical protein